MDMVSRETIESRLRQLNEAENSRPHATVEEVRAGIDKVMAPDVHGWRGGTPVSNRAAEREVERVAFGTLTDYHRTFDILLIEPPYASLRWTLRSAEHTSDLQSLLRITYAVFCLKKTIQQ